jgi:dTDP-4-amino-4,6-dideoxygalactose transaminase
LNLGLKRQQKKGENMESIDYRKDVRFMDIKPFPSRLWLASPTMHGKEQTYVDEAIRTNWVSTMGTNIDEIEKAVVQKLNGGFSVALSSGTAALHLAVKLCGERLYGQPKIGRGTLAGQKVFCSDMTFAATVNPVVYEGGEPVFIDTEYDTWNMDPKALEKAFELYPKVRLVVVAHLYGTPAKIEEISAICKRHNALLIEDAAESFGATYQGRQTATFGDVSIISFNGNKILTGSSGGMLLTASKEEANKARKWSTQSREAAPWYQHEEIGYNYRMSNIIAGVVRGQLPHLEEHIERKREIYERYREGFKGLPVSMNPYETEAIPNFWLSCLLIDREGLSKQVRGEKEALYLSEAGKSSPTEILEVLAAFGAEGRPIWKPMHMQPIFRMTPFVTAKGNGRGQSNAYIEGENLIVGEDIFERGLCLPSDNKMTKEQQDVVIELVKRCFEKGERK